MICMVIGKNPPLFGTNKSDTELWDVGGGIALGDLTASQEGMKLKRHKNTKPQRFICRTDLMKLFRKVRVVSPSNYQITLLPENV